MDVIVIAFAIRIPKEMQHAKKAYHRRPKKQNSIKFPYLGWPVES